MEIQKQVAIFQDKIHEYYLVCLERGPLHGQTKFITNYIVNWPLFQFDISKIHKSICDNHLIPEELYAQCAFKLIDLKLIYCYLITLEEHFYFGPTLVVGNNELEKLNPNTISMLREDHYKVYLLSVIIENILDFFQIVFQKRIKDYKKGKWERILTYITQLNVIPSINQNNASVLITFKQKYRTAELHEFSSVRAFTAKSDWNHFQAEENLVRNIISDITFYFAKLKNQSVSLE